MFGLFGDLVHDYGIIEERRKFLVRTRVSMQLYKKSGEFVLVIKESNLAPLAASVRYTLISEAQLHKLKYAVNDAYERVKVVQKDKIVP